MALLRCLTFNIWKNEGQFERRMAAIAAILGEHRADAIALQECFAAPMLGIDSAAMLAEACGCHLTRYPMRAKPRQHAGASVASRSDMALLTRVAPLDQGMVALPQDTRDGERGVLWADIPVAGRLVRVACTHLTHLDDGLAQLVRHQQAATAIAALTGPGRTVILMGDLNARSTDPTVAPLFGHPALKREARSLAGPGEGPPGSLNRAPADGSIDHVLLYAGEAGPRGHGARMLRRTVIAAPDPHHPAAGASDHPAILAEIEIAADPGQPRA